MTGKEYNKITNGLIRTTVRTLGIKWSSASKRVNALFESGMLDDIQFNPDNKLHQKAIDLFMKIPTDEFKDSTKGSLHLVKNAIYEAMEAHNEKININQ